MSKDVMHRLRVCRFEACCGERRCGVAGVGLEAEPLGAPRGGGLSSYRSLFALHPGGPNL